MGIAEVLLSPEEWEPSTATGGMLFSSGMFVIWLYQGLIRVWEGISEGWENSRKMRPGGHRAGQWQSKPSAQHKWGCFQPALCLEITGLSSFCNF